MCVRPKGCHINFEMKTLHSYFHGVNIDILTQAMNQVDLSAWLDWPFNQLKDRYLLINKRAKWP